MFVWKLWRPGHGARGKSSRCCLAKEAEIAQPLPLLRPQDPARALGGGSLFLTTRTRAFGRSWSQKAKVFAEPSAPGRVPGLEEEGVGSSSDASQIKPGAELVPPQRGAEGPFSRTQAGVLSAVQQQACAAALFSVLLAPTLKSQPCLAAAASYGLASSAPSTFRAPQANPTVVPSSASASPALGRATGEPQRQSQG